jgi:hypothetical protein
VPVTQGGVAWSLLPTFSKVALRAFLRKGCLPAAISASLRFTPFGSGLACFHPVGVAGVCASPLSTGPADYKGIGHDSPDAQNHWVV